jgi:DNA-binding transcriptional ArsR family regulator
MAKFSTNFDKSFAALADPTRRAILTRLSEGPRTVSELSEPFDIALPSLLKHVRVLEESGLVSSQKVGRVRTCQLEPHALQETEAWIHEHLAAWERRLDRLEAHIARMKRKN